MSQCPATELGGSDLCEMQTASFRDPSGFMYRHGGVLYRQVNQRNKSQYRQLMDSGLYSELVKRDMLIPHEEVDGPAADESCAAYVLRPEPVLFISYPYEWSFSQLKDAALLTLDIHRLALEYNMSLKDASAYNVQFHGGKPVFIDTLSFEPYEEGKSWVAYRQFCQHFLAPLALMAKRDVRVAQLLRVYIDGLPLDMTSALLPRRTWLNFGLMMHIHLHAKTQNAFAASNKAPSSATLKLSQVSKTGLIGLIEGLRKTVAGLNWKCGDTEWSDYYNDTNYSDDAFDVKRRYISAYLNETQPRSVWDLGANIGLFSRIAADLGLPTIAFDIDPSAVEVSYRQVRDKNEASILPLLLDLTNPSPALGWNSAERDGLAKRGPVDCVMALALIHHLSISNNVPFEWVASFLAGLCGDTLIIEFVPKSDSQVQRLLRSRTDIFYEYDRDHFERAFSSHFSIKRADEIKDSTRVLYLMQKRHR